MLWQGFWGEQSRLREYLFGCGAVRLEQVRLHERTCEGRFYILHCSGMVLVFRAMEQEGQEQTIYARQVVLAFGSHRLL